MIMKPEDLAARLSQVAEGRITKHGGGSTRDEINKAEMQALLAKLKELVPNMPRGKKLSKLEIIQNVIDYILDLQIALESHPRNQHHRLPPAAPSSNRQPLGVLPASTTVNTPLSSCNNLNTEVSDKPEVSGPTHGARPVSC